MYERRTMFLLEALVNLYRARYLQELSALGIGPGQERLLRFVIDNPGIGQSVVTRRLALHKSVISRAIKALKRIGLLSVRESQGARKLQATSLATRVAKTMHGVTDELEEAMLKGFSDQERDDFKSYLERARTNLGCKRPETDAAGWIIEWKASPVASHRPMDESEPCAILR